MLIHLSLLVALLSSHFLLALSSHHNGTAIPTNHTVGCLDPSITYSILGIPGWSKQLDPMDIGGYHMLAQLDLSAYALFNFSGVAFYFVSTKWPYEVTTDVSIDDENPVKLDLQDYSTPDTGGGPGSVAASVITGWTGLKNGVHTVKISVPPGDPYAVVGQFIYTTLASATTPSSSTPSSSTPSNSSSPTPSNSTSSNSTPSNSTPPNSDKSNSSNSNYKPSVNSKNVIHWIAIGITIVGGLLL